MIELTDEMRHLIDNARDNGNPCILATVDATGRPNAGYIGTIVVFDGQSLAYRDRGSPAALQSLEDHPQVVVLFRDSRTQVGWKFRCTAVLHREGPVSRRVLDQLAAQSLIQDPQGPGCAVVLQVDQVLTLFGEVLQERVPNLQW